jgi:hypothetical protein
MLHDITLQLSGFVTRIPSFDQRYLAGGAEAGITLFAGRQRRVPKYPRTIAVFVYVEPQAITVRQGVFLAIVGGFRILHSECSQSSHR